MRAGLALVLLALAVPAAAQTGNTQSADTIIYGQRAPSWAAHAAVLTTNMVVGGLTAGLIQELRGGSFKDGFTRGALGGSITSVFSAANTALTAP